MGLHRMEKSMATVTGRVTDSLVFMDVPSPTHWEVEFSPEERRILDLINQKVASGQSLDDIMNFVFDTTRELYPCDRIGLSFIEEGNRRVVAHWTRALYEPVLLRKGYAEDLPGSSLNTVMHSGHPRIISDLEHYAQEHPNSRSTRLILKEGVRSSMTCPLIVEGRAVGFLFRSSRKANVYDRHQVRMHQAVAERLSQAVEKAWRIEQLTAANQAYTEMLGFVSHELKSPLASLVMDAETLGGGYLGALNGPQEEKLHKMVAKAQYLLGLIRDYLNLAKIESGQFEGNFRESVNFTDDVVRCAIEVVQALADEKRMHFTIEAPSANVFAECDPELMLIVLVNLLGNAVKYGDDETEIRIRLSLEVSGLRVAVWNSGPGFPKEERVKLFRKFSRLDAPELKKRKGTGVGLYTTWRIIQLHGGHITADSEYGKWAEFSFEIPQPLQESVKHMERRLSYGNGTG